MQRSPLNHPASGTVVQTKQLKNVNEQICQICGDTVGFSATGDFFVACNECVPFRFVTGAMNTNVRRGISVVHSARLDTRGTKITGDIPDASPDRHSIRSPRPRYVDPRILVPVRIVDPSKDLNSYGVSVDRKERVEMWRVKQEKNMMHVTHKYAATGSDGEDLQMADDARLPLSRIVPISMSLTFTE